MAILAIGLAAACSSASEQEHDEQIGELQRQVQNLEDQLQQVRDIMVRDILKIVGHALTLIRIR